jgi:CheY-like chemotaxis protein
LFARALDAPVAPGFAWEETPLAVLLVGLDGTILAANAAAGRLGGISAPALAGTPLGDLVPGLAADWPALVDAVRRDGARTGATPEEAAGRRIAFALSPAETVDRGAAVQVFAIDLGAGHPAAAAAAPPAAAAAPPGAAAAAVPAPAPAPVARPPATYPGTAAGGRSPAPILARLRVLVIDDEPLVRTTVRRLLERRGATVVTAPDGLEGEVRVREERYDLVVCDLAMPGRNGHEVLAAARSVHPEVPFILMSGYTGRLHEAGGLEPDAVLEKPFTARVLDAAIDDVLRRLG